MEVVDPSTAREEVDMPAVTVENPLSLPHVPVPDADAAARPVVSVTTAPRGFEGEGFPVRRAFAGVDLRALDPFIHMDQMGEVEYAPGEPKGTPWHPHRGFETVTYMIDGEMQHHDSHGGGGLIGGGDTQWMTAGSGILHIETPPEHLVQTGGLFHGLQLWVNLPKAQKLAAPRYQDITGAKVTLLSSADGGALVRVIAGEVGGHQGPGSTYTPITRPAPRSRCRGGRTSTRWSTAWPGSAASAWSGGRCGAGSSRCSARATRSPSPPTRRRSRAAPRSTSSCSVAARSASRWSPTARS
jgi:hypothetical protein